MLDNISDCFKNNRVLYTAHAREEMETEELGEIKEAEVFQAVINGEVIETYPDDEPYPCVLVYGKDGAGKPIHTVCAYSREDNLAIVVTVYRPDVKKWVDYRRRR